MPKSDFKGIFQQLFSGAFVPERDVQWGTHCIEDSMIKLRGIGADDETRGLEILNRILSNAIEVLNSDEATLHIMVFDKPSFVPKIKGIEHKRRSRGITPAPDPDQVEEYLPLYTKLPYTWESIMENRKAKRKIIAELTNAICEHFYPPAGKTLIIDGGSEDERAPPIVIESMEVEDGTSPANATQCTIDAGCIDSPDYTRRVVRNAPELVNSIGEGDTFYVFYAHHFVNAHTKKRNTQGIQANDDPIFVDAITDDTDFIPLSMSIAQTLYENNIRMRVRFKTRESNTAYKANNVMDVFSLRAEMAVIPVSMASWVVALISRGNDYVDSYHGIGSDKMVSALLKHNHVIGELININATTRVWTINPLNYIRFVRCLYFQANQERFLSKFPDAVKDGTWATMPWSTFKDIVKSGHPKSPNSCVPSDIVIYFRYLRSSLNVILMTEEYTSTEGCRVDELCLQYGYTLIDRFGPLAYHNVRLSGDGDGAVPDDFCLLLNQ